MSQGAFDDKAWSVHREILQRLIADDAPLVADIREQMVRSETKGVKHVTFFFEWYTNPLYFLSGPELLLNAERIGADHFCAKIHHGHEVWDALASDATRRHEFASLVATRFGVRAMVERCRGVPGSIRLHLFWDECAVAVPERTGDLDERVD